MKNHLFQKLFSIIIISIVVLCSGQSASAGYNEGLAAYKRGDYATAFNEFRPLAEKGDTSAQTYLGWLYETGLGVPQGYQEAMKWFRKAAKQGHAMAQFSLGLMYGLGRGGVPKSNEESVKWFRKAAEQGHAKAQYLLGWGYLGGKGVPKDEVQALMWFILAKMGGIKRAPTLIALLENRMIPSQIEQAKQLAQEWKPKKRK